MDIAVEGLRTSITDWEAVRYIPAEQLPRLTREQLEVAKKLSISPEDYARSVLAGQRTMERLLAKTERLARLLQGQVRARNAQALVERVTLNTWEDRFEVDIKMNGALVPLRIDESLVDDLMEAGSIGAEERLSRILDLALHARVS